MYHLIKNIYIERNFINRFSGEFNLKIHFTCVIWWHLMPSDDIPEWQRFICLYIRSRIQFMSNPKKDSTMRKRILFSVLSMLLSAGVFAQGEGLAGINEATSLMTSYFDPATKLCYAIGAVLGLVGGIKTYGKFSSGDPDTSKTAASWFFACIFLIVAATILRSFFL